ncbi:hypothetical protein JCM19046_3994 [Bacillus sp. JCM 19046]|nr:hypothetical protein JCM19046_3994 [Bacillus sp. JCM 19046]
MIDIERTQKNHLNQTNFVPKKTVGTKAFKSSFNQAMHVHSKQTFSDRIEDLLEDGKRLAQSRTAGDLKNYRAKVRACLDYLVNEGLELERTTSMASGRFKHHQLVKTIDFELEALTKDVFNQQKTEFDLLKRIGELQGLIIQFYV